MKQKYGQAVIDELDGLALTVLVFSPMELKEMTKLYKDKANRLLAKFGFK